MSRASVVVLRHHRTDQQVTVPAHQYQHHHQGRFRNWSLARGNLLVRPILTLTECANGQTGQGHHG